MKEIDEITGTIVDAAYKVHIELGPGLQETVYEAILAHELEKRGLLVERQKTISFEYDGIQFHEGLRVDLLVERKVIIELKSMEKHAPLHAKQVLTYLRLLHLSVGLLINFGAPTMKEGLRRIVNHYQPTSNSHLRVNQERDEHEIDPSHRAGSPQARF